MTIKPIRNDEDLQRAFKRLEGVAPRHYRPSLLRHQAANPA